jgi:hypothetical protein
MSKITKIGETLDLEKLAGLVEDLKVEEEENQEDAATVIDTPVPENKPSLMEIYRGQNKLMIDPRASDMQQDFILKALAAGYTKSEIVEGLREIFRIAYGEWKYNQTMDDVAKWSALEHTGLVKE